MSGGKRGQEMRVELVFASSKDGASRIRRAYALLLSAALQDEERSPAAEPDADEPESEPGSSHQRDTPTERSDASNCV